MGKYSQVGNEGKKDIHIMGTQDDLALLKFLTFFFSNSYGFIFFLLILHY